MKEKPEFVSEDHLSYLDSLRETGVTNMFGAASYVQASFPELTERQARSVLAYWMETFTERHPA